MLHFKKTKSAVSLIIAFIVLSSNFNVANATLGWSASEPPARITYGEYYCDVSIANGIRTDKHYAEASTTLTTSNSTINRGGSVSAAFYVLNTSTNETSSFGRGDGGANGGGVTATRSGDEVFYKVVSDHTATYGTAYYHYDDLTCVAP